MAPPAPPTVVAEPAEPPVVPPTPPVPGAGQDAGAVHVPFVAQTLVPAGQAQTLLVQTCPAGHDALLPLVQLHCEFTQLAPDGHAVMHEPQWFASELSV
jgi:hypothetical protein